MKIVPKQGSSHYGRDSRPTREFRPAKPKVRSELDFILQTDGVKSLSFEGSQVIVMVSKDMSESIRCGIPKVADGREVVLVEKKS